MVKGIQIQQIVYIKYFQFLVYLIKKLIQWFSVDNINVGASDITEYEISIKR
jgi:hypothetical protein